MKEIIKKYWIQFIILITMAFSFISCFVILIKSTPTEVITESEVIDYSDGWTSFIDGNYIEVTLPFEAVLRTEEYISFYKELPLEIDNDLFFSVDTNYNAIRVLVDGEIIYIDKGYSDDTLSYKLTLHNFSVDKKYQGKNLEIQILRTSSKEKVRLNSIEFASKAEVLSNYFKESIHNIVICILFLFAGLIYILASFLMFRKKDAVTSKSLFYIALFSFISAIWILTNTDEMHMTFKYQKFAFMISNVVFLLLPLPILLLIKLISCKNKKLLDAAIIVVALNCIIKVFLAITGISNFPDSLVSSHVILGVAIVLLGYVIYDEYFKVKNRDFRYIFLGIVILLFFSLIDLIRYYFNYGAPSDMIFFKTGIFIFTILLGYIIFAKVILSAQSHIELETYKKLAYNDPMTKLGNRLAFNKNISTILEANYNSITVIMYDLDNLKIINDSYGHLHGDEIIKAFAGFITEVFSETNSYRIGGDEFVTIICDIEEDLVKEKLEILSRKIASFNNLHEYKLYASFDYIIDDGSYTNYSNFDNLFKKADEKMYVMKEKNKEFRQEMSRIEEEMGITFVVKESFSVIGKEGSTELAGNWIENLWNETNSNFDQISELAKVDEDGNYLGMWGLMSDFERKFKPWENDFSEGLYLAGVEAVDDAIAPDGFTKWTVPSFKYVCAKVNDDYMNVFGFILNDYLRYINMDLVASIHEYYSGSDGQMYLFFPVEKINEE